MSLVSSPGTGTLIEATLPTPRGDTSAATGESGIAPLPAIAAA
jgi:hypothetical protein